MFDPPAVCLSLEVSPPSWSADCADALDWLRAKPSGWADLCVTSPPYTKARTYGIGAKRSPEQWVRWLRPIVVELCRVSRIVALNISDQTKNWRYGAADIYLIADLLRLDGLQLGPAPYAWVKPGVSGSGQDHYHRRNWEPVYVLARPENLPPRWSNNTAFGKPPKYGPGGEKSDRISAGTMVNQWGGKGLCDRVRRKNGRRPKKGRPSHSAASPRCAPVDGVIANPGNVIATGNGNQVGHKLASENEAPMNLAVAERFVRWFCPPDGLVIDPFMGSGTTAHAAVKHGRRFAGCDVRPCQVELTGRRMETVEIGAQ
jgi:DNA methylase